MFGSRDPVGQDVDVVGHVLEDRHHLAHAIGRSGDVGVEQCPRHDEQRQAHHLFVDVQSCAVLPGLQHPQAVFHHCVRIGFDASGVQGRLHQFALAFPELAVTGQQPVAQEPGQPAFFVLVVPSLVELGRLLDRYLVDVVGIGQHEDVERVADAEMDRIPVVCVHVADDAQQVLLEAAHHPQLGEKVAPDRRWTGW